MSLPNVVTNLGDVRPIVEKVASEIAHRWTIFYMWGIGPSGEHAEGRALDVMTYEYGGGVDNPGPIRREMGRAIADYCWENRARWGLWYVIYDRRIISMTRPSRGWIPYTGPNPHEDHVHISFYNNATYMPPEDDMPSEQEIWHHPIDNLNWSAPGEYKQAGRKRAERMLAEVEAMTDRNAAQIGALADAVRALSKGLGAEVEQAVEAALANATVQVDVNVTGGDEHV